jgi:L-ribulose-5-phosphate 4-epimerase
MSLYRKLKERAWRCNLELDRLGLVIHTFGNVSAFDSTRGVFAIKPSGVPYEQMGIDDIVVVDLDNKVVEGKLRPSSDTKTHAILYRNLKDIGGIVHTHSTYATAWAQSGKPIPIMGTTHADLAPVDIPCTKIMTPQMVKGDYEEETGRLIVERFAKLSHREVEMVLVAGHGPFTWGKSPEKAVENSLMLEEIARIAFLTLQINGKTPRLKKYLIDKHYLRKHGKNAYYGQQ